MSQENRKCLALDYHGARWQAGVYNPFTGRVCMPWWLRVLGVLGIVPFLAAYTDVMWSLVFRTKESDILNQVLTFGMVCMVGVMAVVALWFAWGQFLVSFAAIAGVGAQLLGIWGNRFPSKVGIDLPVWFDLETWEAALVTGAMIPVLHVAGFAWCTLRSLAAMPLPSFARFGMVFGRRQPVQRQASGAFGFLAVLEDRFLTDKVVTLRLGRSRTGIKIEPGRPRGTVLGLSEQSGFVAFGHDERIWIRSGRLGECGRVALMYPFRYVESTEVEHLAWQPVEDLPMRDLFEEGQIFYAKRYADGAARSSPLAVLLRQRQGSGAEIALVVRRPKGHCVVEYPYEGTAVAVKNGDNAALAVEIEFVSGESVSFPVSLRQVAVATRRSRGLFEYFLWVPFES